MGRVIMDKLEETAYNRSGGYKTTMSMWQRETGLPVEFRLGGYSTIVEFDANLQKLERLKVAIDYAILNYYKPDEEPKHFYKVKQSVTEVAMGLSGKPETGWLCKASWAEKYFVNEFDFSFKDRVALTEKEFGKAIEGNGWLGEILEKVEVESDDTN
ncbi:hypothetical protein PQD69_gp052 [Carnobacterium phage cd4]|uniref:Uncharacterized protein n=1 Tax=Carnobacterium phage cd4 TaxID=2849246 RepID=A0AAE7SWL1_9CAUD|nr:hypothetical protein PQD69_gp052 [Carnobacterium phage cd4]QXP45349.1 hypothetical protein cd4_052 [Carnobacterium phage cd4]